MNNKQFEKLIEQEIEKVVHNKETINEQFKKGQRVSYTDESGKRKVGVILKKITKTFRGNKIVQFLIGSNSNDNIYYADHVSSVLGKEHEKLKLESVNEDLPTKIVDPKEFPNPLKQTKGFLKKGKYDGANFDDVVKTNDVSISVSELKPSQDAIYLGKSIAMAINGVEGGDLGAVISKDNYILDGHHRYAATTFNNPSAKVGGVQANLNIGDLVPVLRAAGDAMNNNRGVAPAGGDINIFKATIEDIKDIVYNGKNVSPKFYNKEKAIAWYEGIGESTIAKRLKMLQSKRPPSAAPQRKDMPKIKPDQINLIKTLLNKGKIDVKAPYTESITNNTYNRLVTEELNKFLTKLAEAADMITYRGKDGKTHKITRQSALSYDKKHPAYKAAVKNDSSKKQSNGGVNIFDKPTSKPSKTSPEEEVNQALADEDVFFKDSKGMYKTVKYKDAIKQPSYTDDFKNAYKMQKKALKKLEKTNSTPVTKKTKPTGPKGAIKVDTIKRMNDRKVEDHIINRTNKYMKAVGFNNKERADYEDFVLGRGTSLARKLLTKGDDFIVNHMKSYKKNYMSNEAVTENTLNEGKWDKIMKAVRKNPQGPFSVVAIKDKKVVGQKISIKIPDMIPAYYEEMKKTHPGARISIENGEGTQVYFESVNEAAVKLRAFGETETLNVKVYKDKTGHPYVSLYTSDGEPYADITVILPETKDLPKDEFFAKGWSENKEIVLQLIKNKVLIPTAKKAATGMVTAHSFKLNPKYK